MWLNDILENSFPDFQSILTKDCPIILIVDHKRCSPHQILTRATNFIPNICLHIPNIRNHIDEWFHLLIGWFDLLANLAHQYTKQLCWFKYKDQHNIVALWLNHYLPCYVVSHQRHIRLIVPQRTPTGLLETSQVIWRMTHHPLISIPILNEVITPVLVHSWLIKVHIQKI